MLSSAKPSKKGLNFVNRFYYTEKDANGVWQTITDDAAKAQFGKSAGELKAQYEVYGPRLILAEYYNKVVLTYAFQKFSQRDYLWPISQNQMLINPKLTQNYGW